MRFFFRTAATLVLMAASWGCQADDGATTPGGVGGSAAGSAGQPGQGGAGGASAGAAGQTGGSGGAPPGWTCDPSWYGDDSCDDSCGITDIDCGGTGGSGGGDAGAGGSGPPKDPIQLRVATFNAENFFNDKADDPPPVGAEEKLSPSEYQAKLAGVAAIVAKTNADVIMLEEVENDAVLAALQARPELGGKYVDRAIFKGNDPRGIDIAALSTVPFTKKVSHKDDEFALAGTGGSDKYRFARDLLEVHADVNGRHMIFLGVHLKAKSNDDPQKRLAEAQRARFVADTRRKEDPSAFVIILGDFNDFPGSPPMNAVQGEAPGEIYEGMGPQLGSALAWSVFSQSAPGGKALHDDLRVCPPLFERVVKGSIKIFHDEDLAPSLQKVSDHAPVAATFQIN